MRALTSLIKDQSKEIRRLEKMSEKYAPYVWKISNFQAVHERAISGEQESLLSEAFYLSKNGYKLRIKLLPNGGCADPEQNKIIRGNYLSVFIKVIPGEYDSILTWPFDKKIRISLIDQEVNKENRVNAIKIVYFQYDSRPCPQTEPENGYGFGNFIHHNDLQTRKYLKNDNIFIMVSQA